MSKASGKKGKAMPPSSMAASAIQEAGRSGRDPADQRQAIQVAANGLSLTRRATDLETPIIPARRLHLVLERARGKKLLICIKGYPDPDNIAAALCLQWLAHHHNIKTKIKKRICIIILWIIILKKRMRTALHLLHLLPHPHLLPPLIPFHPPPPQLPPPPLPHLLPPLPPKCGGGNVARRRPLRNHRAK